MRARLGIYLSNTCVDLREIVLKHKPQPMLDASPKGTVPVLLLANGEVIEESLDIMCWALHQSDPNNLLLADNQRQQEVAKALIESNDNDFKPWLDKYKYADRYPENTEVFYRSQGEKFIAQLDHLLSKQKNILADSMSIADIAIFPFIRQFAAVDTMWFNQAPYPNVQRWLNEHVNSPTFKAIMNKYPTWLESGESFTFPH